MQNNTNIITSNELACFYLTSAMLHTHKHLKQHNIIWASNYITSVYNSGILDIKELTMFLTYCNQDGIGKLALTFNANLVSAVQSSNIQLINDLLSNLQDGFVELFDNRYLSLIDKEFLIRLVHRESFSVSLTLNMLKDNNIPKDTKNLLTCSYGKVCIQDAKILQDDSVRGIISRHETLPQTITTIDKPSDSTNVQIYCFDTLDLLKAMMSDVPINPLSRQPFSPYTLQLINSRFSKEIAMYRRYHNKS